MTLRAGWRRSPAIAAVTVSVIPLAALLAPLLIRMLRPDPVVETATGCVLIAGGLAGLSGSIEVAGSRHNLIEGMQSNYLLLGLIIGLIAQGNNLAVPFVAFFIAVLEVGASAMQRTIQLPGEISMIIEALILIFVLLSNVIGKRR